MLRWARVLVVAILALFVVGAATAPGSVLAQDAAPTTVTTRLYPGWNMVGWVGKTASVSTLFEAVPELIQVQGWDTEAQRFRRSTPRSTGYRMGQVRAGQGLWLELGGDAPFDWERPVTDRYVLLSLEEGLNLVGWTGSDGAPMEEAVGRFGDELRYAFRWDAEAQRFDAYLPGAGPFNTLDELNRGDALWVELADEATWWQSGTGRTLFDFGEEVSAERQLEIRRVLAKVIGFFAELYGVEPPQFTLSSGADAQSAVTTRFRGTPPTSVVELSLLEIAHDLVEDDLEVVLAHEYFHVLQHNLARYPYPPSWMTEGAADYAGAVYEVSLLEGDGSTIRLNWSYRAELFARAFKALEDEDAPSFNKPATYPVGALAVDWLVGHAALQQGSGELPQPLSVARRGEHDAYLEYYRLLPTSKSWEEAFESAFNVSPDDFYPEFERYREELSGPVVVFLGDLPEATRATLKAQATETQTYFTESLGIKPFTIVSYISADEEWGRVARERLIRAGVLGSAPSSCSVFLRGLAILYEVNCEFSLRHQSYFNRYLEALQARLDTGPYWLGAGIKEYLEASYEEREGLATYDAELRRRTEEARGNPTPLAELADRDGWVAADGTGRWALAFVAVDRLLDGTDPGALKEYIDLLPRGEPDWPDFERGAGSWQAAFEQAFGLTVEEFYEEFAEYRAGLSGP